MNKTLVALLILSLLFMVGCAYYSETAVRISADKLKGIIPAGVVPIPAEAGKPEGWLVRKMSFKLWRD